MQCGWEVECEGESGTEDYAVLIKGERECGCGCAVVRYIAAASDGLVDVRLAVGPGLCMLEQ